MQFTKETNQLFIGLLTGFFIIAGVASYWAITGEDTILQRDDNARLFEAEASIMRGSIYDRNNITLVESNLRDNDVVVRQYNYPAMYSALGYFSLRYGVGGAESAFDDILSGSNLNQNFNTYFQHEILHYPREGSDIQLTLDLTVQQAIVDAMGDSTGAVVLLSVPDGEVLAMVSQPTFDPNNLDDTWDDLIQADNRPFFNRTLQGNYQSGSILYLTSIVAALSNNYDLSQPIENATQNVILDDLTLQCLLTPETNTFTLAEAFVWGCPHPLTLMVDAVGLNRVESVFERFLFTPQTTLQDFVNPTTEADDEPEITPEASNSLNEFSLADVLGQGEITITPLNMAMIAGALINDGNAPLPIVQLAQRAPNDITWEAIIHMPQSIPIMTRENSATIRDLMMQTQDPVLNDSLLGGGYRAIAFSGEQVNTWYIGFVTLSDTSGFAVAVLLENSEDIVYAQSIGEIALTEAVNTITTTD